jgi:rhamnose utilization protein RhaD (predicted bifunctional aldolase and dehydrogenase)
MSATSTKRTKSVLASLISLSHGLGREERGLAILGEGNTSARIDDKTFFVKASGTSLGSLAPDDVVECRFDVLLALILGNGGSGGTVTDTLMASRKSHRGKTPTVEALFHAYFLSLPDVQYVGHTHATAVGSILCSPRAREFAENRLFPDEVVCCGPVSVLVPYADPGLFLAREIRKSTDNFIARYGRAPRVVLVENHGIIALGKTPDAVIAATLMAEKAAQVWLGAASLGGPHFMSPQEVQSIAERDDELYRQRILNL